MGALIGYAIAGGVIILIIAVAAFIPRVDCRDTSLYYRGTVEFIFDGDTIQVEGCKIRLALADTPERDMPGYFEATNFTANLCPKGSSVLIDQDDLQPHDKYNRVLANVICSDKNLSEELLENGHAKILTRFCNTSEFASESWATKFGC
ncbi:MAG TPA: thermonuclease family protein [Nitrosopumilaceae archaeon]|nr:thermonuclease family protein [Nitrosopumilaceae archaeon]